MVVDVPGRIGGGGERSPDEMLAPSIGIRNGAHRQNLVAIRDAGVLDQLSIDKDLVSEAAECHEPVLTSGLRPERKAGRVVDIETLAKRVTSVGIPHRHSTVGSDHDRRRPDPIVKREDPAEGDRAKSTGNHGGKHVEISPMKIGGVSARVWSGENRRTLLV